MKLRIEIDLDNVDELKFEIDRIIAWAKNERKFGIKETWLPLSNINAVHVGNAYIDEEIYGPGGPAR